MTVVRRNTDSCRRRAAPNFPCATARASSVIAVMSTLDEPARSSTAPRLRCSRKDRADPRRRAIYEKLASAERRRVAFWEEGLRAAGQRVPPFRAAVRHRSRRLGIGFVVPSVIAREMKDPGRSRPRALTGSVCASGRPRNVCGRIEQRVHQRRGHRHRAGLADPGGLQRRAPAGDKQRKHHPEASGDTRARRVTCLTRQARAPLASLGARSWWPRSAAGRRRPRPRSRARYAPPSPDRRCRLR